MASGRNSGPTYRHIVSYFLLLSLLGAGLATAQESVDPGTRHVHDPSIIKEGDYYYVYSTGDRIAMRRSSDLYHWEFLGSVLPSIPSWVQSKISGVSNLWAPGPIFHNGKYYLCYSGSLWGTNTSTIGLLSNMTLDPDNLDYNWVDEGEIISSAGVSVPYNTIDGEFVFDAGGGLWLVFGSFWNGIYIVELNPATVKPYNNPPAVTHLAARPGVQYNPIEAPYILYRNGYYYLFVNYDSCCQGVDSTYKIMVGRSTSITGPYRDKNNVQMTNGGGTLFVDTAGRWIGPGHLSVVSDGGQDFMTFHAYDGLDNGTPTLRAHYLYWSGDLWPVMGEAVSDPYSDETIAHWNFEDGAPGTALPNTSEGANPGVVGTADLSVHGNDLMAWNSANAPMFSSAGQTPSGAGLSAVFAGAQDGYTTGANVAGIDLRGITPAQWTIEASVLFHSLGSWQTFVGRDGSGVVTGDSNLSPLYFQKTYQHYLRIQFATVDGQLYLATAPWAVQTNRWYHVVARSTGEMLELYVDQLDGEGFQLEASTPMTGNTALAMSSAASAWSVGRAMWGGNVVDHLDGKVDDVRISTVALEPAEFLQYRDVAVIVTEPEGGVAVSEEGPTSDSYQIRLDIPTGGAAPSAHVTVSLTTDGQVTVYPEELVFTPMNWADDQTVIVTAVDDAILEADPHEGRIEHLVSSSDARFNHLSVPDVTVTITENNCGAWGYQLWDQNFDCAVNLEDLALVAMAWVGEVETVRDFAEEWLSTTQPYVPGAVVGPVGDTGNLLQVQTDTVLNPVDEKIYGHFLEHIYNSVNGGLWGELVWNRSMEMLPSGGAWSVDGDELVQSSLGTNIRLMFGETSWTDYELLLEAQKTGGSEGFLIIFRADGDRFYWANLGGWGNTRHQFEKGVDGGTWGTVGSSFSGSINTGQWYSIRIRCGGSRIRAYIDGSLVLDYTDSSGHLTGQVGLGTWATQARFRNIRVVNYNNTSEVWYSGLPAVPPMPLAGFWGSYGDGTFVMTGSDALNGDYSLRIDNAGPGEAGIQQTPFNITAQNYTGSLWAKGSGSLTVRLADGAQTLAQSALGSLSGTWTEYPFVLSPSAAAGNATLQIVLTGAGQAYIDQVSLMGQDAIDIGGFRPDLYAAVDALQAPVIRWPGGCYASAYFWKDGIGAQHERNKYPINLWDDQDTNSYGTDEFLQMCEQMGVEPIVVINTGVVNSTCGVAIPYKLSDAQYLQDVLDWMEYCNGDAGTTWGAQRAANGRIEPYNVRFWEIDNETWSAGSAAYIAKVLTFVPAMQAKAAQLGTPIEIIAVGGNGYDQGWNQDILNGCADIIDYISVHYYADPSQYATAPGSYEDFIWNLAGRIASSSNPNVKIYNSEWNAQSTDWRTGLYAGGILNVYERTGEVFKIGGPALFLRHVSASAWDNAFINFDHSGWFAAPNYVVMKLWREYYAPYRVAIDGQVDGVNTVATLSEDGNRLIFKAVNSTTESVPVRLVPTGGFEVASATFKLVAPGSLGARNTLSSPDTVRVENGAVSVFGNAVRFTLPPLSAGVVEIVAQP